MTLPPRCLCLVQHSHTLRHRHFPLPSLRAPLAHGCAARHLAGTAGAGTPSLWATPTTPPRPRRCRTASLPPCCAYSQSSTSTLACEAEILQHLGGGCAHSPCSASTSVCEAEYLATQLLLLPLAGAGSGAWCCWLDPAAEGADGRRCCKARRWRRACLAGSLSQQALMSA
jgi:hypothetical protein